MMPARSGSGMLGSVFTTTRNSMPLLDSLALK
jgi:hypothetical protein